MDLSKIAEEQQVKLEKDREERKEQIKVAKEAQAAAAEAAAATDSGDKTGASTDGQSKAPTADSGNNANHKAY